ncbi:MAG: hypothetical protein KA319_03430 [Ferruginibacter sp.]|nr:hypothetical protein [Ferruginibacter sp.]
MKSLIILLSIVLAINANAQTTEVCNCKKPDKKNTVLIDGTITLTNKVINGRGGFIETYLFDAVLKNEGNCEALILGVNIGSGAILINNTISQQSNSNTQSINKEFKIKNKLPITNDGEDNWVMATIKFKVHNKVCLQKQPIKLIHP